MKVTNFNKKENTGVLTVPNNRGENQSFTFELDKLFNWYPCCTRYTYRYSDSRKKFYLVLQEKIRELPIRYNVDYRTYKVDYTTATMDKKSWYNKEVSKENKELFEFAKNYDIITPDQDFSYEDIQESLEKVQDIFDMLFTLSKEKVEKDYVKRFKENQITPKEEKEYNKFVRMDNENAATFVLRRIPQNTKEMYARFGEVYVMLELMRKMTI